MNFDEYQQKFISEAKLKGKSEEYILKCLNYAHNLYINKLPIIFDQNHLIELMGIDAEYIYKVCNKPSLFYRKFKIFKKNGDSRTIYEPLPTLKKAQYFILNEILSHLNTSIYSKAYKKKSSIKDNVKFHRKQRYVLCMDIEKYFDNISSYSVYNRLFSVGYKNDVAMMITKLCTLKGSLPQGAPTSPILSNALTVNLDNKLAILAKANNVRYTRYADDITISGDFYLKSIVKKIKMILWQEGFTANNDKTRVMSQGCRQVVTGIVVNNKAQVDKKKRKEIRKNMYFIQKFGLQNHLEHIHYEKDEYSYLKQLRGKMGFVLFVNPKDNEIKGYMEKLKNLINEKSI